jgi:hypothetical protein
MYYWNVLFNLSLLIPMDPNTISEGTANPRNVIIPQTLPRKVLGSIGYILGMYYVLECTIW